MEWLSLAGVVVTGICTIVAVVLSNVASNNKVAAMLDKSQAVFEAKVTEEIGQLKSQVEKHNNIIERTYKLENEVSVHEEKIKVANNRIKNLEDRTH